MLDELGRLPAPEPQAARLDARNRTAKSGTLRFDMMAFSDKIVE
jgi:hypothetical protein